MDQRPREGRPETTIRQPVHHAGVARNVLRGSAEAAAERDAQHVGGRRPDDQPESGPLQYPRGRPGRDADSGRASLHRSVCGTPAVHRTNRAGVGALRRRLGAAARETDPRVGRGDQAQHHTGRQRPDRGARQREAAEDQFRAGGRGDFGGMFRPVHASGNIGRGGRVALSLLQQEARGREEAGPLVIARHTSHTLEAIPPAVQAAIDVQADHAGGLSPVRLRHDAASCPQRRPNGAQQRHHSGRSRLVAVEEAAAAAAQHPQVRRERVRSLRYMQSSRAGSPGWTLHRVLQESVRHAVVLLRRHPRGGGQRHQPHHERGVHAVLPTQRPHPQLHRQFVRRVHELSRLGPGPLGVENAAVSFQQQKRRQRDQQQAEQVAGSAVSGEDRRGEEHDQLQQRLSQLRDFAAKEEERSDGNRHRTDRSLFGR